MAPSIPSAKITLSCPLFAADFDPRNHGLLLVGGGGGEGRSGVGNKIALLNVSKRQEISELVDIQLSRDEDSVTSLAVAESRDDSMIVLAGINSSQAEQIKGNNRHLRSFRLELPPRTTDKQSSDTAGDKDIKSTTALGQVSLFNSNSGGTNKDGQRPAAKVDTYQRLLRLSPYQNPEGTRIGAIATGLAPVGEIVVFNLSPQPQAKDVLGRIRLGSGEEAEDIDIIEIGDGKFLVAYTNGTEVCTFEISSSKRSNTAPEVRSVFTLPKSSPKRCKYRALRFLSPTALLLLQNTVDRTGCELSILSLPISGTGTKNGTILRRKRLRKSMKIGLSLDVAHLGEGQNHERQYLVALAGSDQSLEILTVDYIPNKGYGSLQVFSTLNEVHPFSMTKVCFSHHRPPTYPVTASTPPQYVKLASISLGNTVVVHTFPLLPQRTLQGRETPSPRYALRAPGRSDTLDTIFTTSVALLVVAISCFLLQAFTEIRGLTPAYLGATEWLPGRVRDSIARPYLHDLTDTGYGYQVTSTATATASAISIAADSTLPLSMIPDEHLRQLLRARQTSSGIDTVLDSIATPSPLSRHIIIKYNPEQDSIYAYYHHDPDHDRDSAADIDGDSNPSSSSSSSTQQKHKIRKWEDLDPQQREKWRHYLSKSGHMALAEGEQVLRGIFFGEIRGVMAAAARGG